MPHVSVKLYPGRTEEQKKQLAEAIAKDVIEVLGSKPESVSVSIEDVPAEEWREKVVRPEIVEKADRVYRKPGYPV